MNSFFGTSGKLFWQISSKQFMYLKKEKMRANNTSGVHFVYVRPFSPLCYNVGLCRKLECCQCLETRQALLQGEHLFSGFVCIANVPDLVRR